MSSPSPYRRPSGPGRRQQPRPQARPAARPRAGEWDEEDYDDGYDDGYGDRYGDRPIGGGTTVRGTPRGLSAFGGGLLILAFGAVGAIGDLIVSGSLGWLMGVFFVIGCLIAAGRTHPDDVAWVIVNPPLAYGILTFVFTIIHSSGSSEPGLKGKAIDIASSLVFNAPILLVGTILTAIIAIIRIQRGRSTPARPRTRRR